MQLPETWRQKVEASPDLMYAPGAVDRILFRREGARTSCPACRYDGSMQRWVIFPCVCPGVRARDADYCRGCPIL